MHQVILLLAITLAAPGESAPKPECKSTTTIVANPDGTTTIRTRTVCVQEGK